MLRRLSTLCASLGLLLLAIAAPAASITYAFTVRDSTVTTGDNRKTGLSPTFALAKKLSDNTTVSSPTIVEVGNGIYKFAYDAEANGEIAWEIDAGASLTNPSDRYVDGIATLDSSRVLSGISSAGQVVASSVQGSVTGSVASVTGAVGSVTGAVGSVTAGVQIGSYASGQDPWTLICNGVIPTSPTTNTGAEALKFVAAVKTKTDNLTAHPADKTDVKVNVSLPGG